MNDRARPGFTLADLMLLVAALGVLLAVLLPLGAATRRLAGQAASADNLRTLAASHFVYAIDWNGRQLTYVVDDVSWYGGPSGWASTYEHVNDRANPPISMGKKAKS